MEWHYWNRINFFKFKWIIDELNNLWYKHFIWEQYLDADFNNWIWFFVNTTNMKNRIIHLILSTVFAVIIWFMASISTMMTIPITGYILTAIAQIMNDNFDITIQILWWVYTVLISYYFYKFMFDII